ncbi:hypothetical protein LIER_18752 [Lithospermum erythrorhizon]|uniref:F-box associated domain-containing protein n=1 Tax=Lithospermum erythrorhizon TaxID=34254 RepID=A0AAV3QHH9_LITER
MVPLGSSLHWLVQQTRMSERIGTILIEPKWGGTRSICAFDMTEERVRALQMPQQVALIKSFGYGLGVLLDKLCFWEILFNNAYVNVWVMDEYGVEESWIKRSVLKVSALPLDINLSRLTPLALLMIYDMVSNSLKGMHLSGNNANCTIPIVPDFVSFKNRVGWITDV